MLTIKQLRGKIDKIDADIIKKLSRRKVLSIKIGKIKSKLKTKVVDNKREEQLMRYYEKLCSEFNLQPSFVKKLFKIIISNSKELQKWQ